MVSPSTELLRRKKRDFYDSHDRRSYERHWAIAIKLLEEPALLQNARAYLERFVRDDPHQTHVFAVWSRLVSQTPGEVALRLIEDTADGAFLRETAPPFRGLTDREREQTFRAFP